MTVCGVVSSMRQALLQKHQHQLPSHRRKRYLMTNHLLKR
jgi:hypothetical protein